MDTVQECFGWAAACLTVCYYVAPVILFINVLKGKLNFEDTPIIFVSVCYVNCFIWYIYGDITFSDQIKISNIVATGISFILICIYLIYEIKKYLIDTILNALILISGTWAIYRALTIVLDDDKIIGKILIGTTAIVYISPIQILLRVIKEKNYILIPVFSAWVYLFACIAWVVYGIFIDDSYVVFPHSAGIILSLIQIIVFLNFKKKYPTIGERDFSSTIGIETTENEESKKEENVNNNFAEENQKTKVKPVKIVSKTDI